MNVEEAKAEAIRVTEEQHAAHEAWKKGTAARKVRLAELVQVWAPAQFPYKVGERFKNPVSWAKGVWEIVALSGDIHRPYDFEPDSKHRFEAGAVICNIKKNGDRGVQTKEVPYWPDDGEWERA